MTLRMAREERAEMSDGSEDSWLLQRERMEREEQWQIYSG